MSSNSVIEHRANYHYIQMSEEYLLICSKGNASPHCKALILSVLEQWTNTKRDSNQPLDSIYMTYPQWEQALYYLYSKNIIVACLTELLAEKMIARKEHRSPNGKNTYTYELKIEEVQTALKALPDKSTKDLLPRLDAFKNAPRKTQSKEDAVKFDRETQSNLTDDAVKLGRNVSSYIDSSQKESVVPTPTESQPKETPTPVFVSDDYKQPVVSLRLSPPQSLYQCTEPPPSQPIQAIRVMYEKVAGPGGYAKWDWDAMKSMAEAKVAQEDIKLVYEHLKKKGKKRNVEQVWQNWSELDTLRKPTQEQKTTGRGISGMNRIQAPAGFGGTQ